jgi:hypothetical protein
MGVDLKNHGYPMKMSLSNKRSMENQGDGGAKKKYLNTTFGCLLISDFQTT